MTWLKPLVLAGRDLLPIVQGGMGVGISAHRLAGAVAGQNGVGTIASVDLRHHHPDLVERTERSRDRELIDAANREALDREVRAALALAQGRGLIAVNVMKAVRDHPGLVRQACESGAHAIVMGAGLPMDLPEMTADHPDVALVPILSEARGVSAVLKKWMKKGRMAAAVVIEHPGHAGGHLGAARIDDLHDERFDFGKVLAGCRQVFADLQLGRDAPKIILAGGVGSHEQVRHWLGEGADGIQVGTAFAVTEECDAHENFKRVLIDAEPEQLLEFTSVAGLPARAVGTPWLTRYLKQEETLQANTRNDPRRCSQRMDCLTQCGLRDGIARFGQFCIDLKLAAALRGEVSKGLFFRGASRLPFGNAVRSVRELMDYLLHGHVPA
ncbi:NAD(P)H-dependent flavin oxidoreductase [Bordetella genomosp. 5]|uniref:2-nitropropane dioxygenase n=1 Tax=Bordetella genomosp. 5 TaxID=1395608 RepID=A0A261T0Q7_9BORD|nr:nitronate monooxygenase family protein [Bordetella genomosp. 5]OZI42710.1 2-nitropropane dioxygenase [Bordetella genomosp. 5]